MSVPFSSKSVTTSDIYGERRGRGGEGRFGTEAKQHRVAVLIFVYLLLFFFLLQIAHDILSQFIV